MLNSYNCRIGKCWWQTSQDTIMVHRLYFWSCTFNSHHCQNLYSNNLDDMRVTLKVVTFNSNSNDCIVIFGIFIHESFNFRILQLLLMPLCGGQQYKINIFANIYLLVKGKFLTLVVNFLFCVSFRVYFFIELNCILYRRLCFFLFLLIPKVIWILHCTMLSR